MIHEIDEHIEAHEIALSSATPTTATGLQLQIEKICAVYQKVKPIIKFVRGLLFWRPKWQAVIDEFTTIGDGICPTPPTV